MYKFLLIILLLAGREASARDTLVRGQVIDRDDGAPLAGASVAVKGLEQATITDGGGLFLLRLQPNRRVLIEVSFSGYASQVLAVEANADSVMIRIALDRLVRPGEGVVVSASRRPERIVEAPASIFVINRQTLERFPGSNTTELLARMPAIEYTRSGVDEITLNARGLNSAFNNKVFQLVDGRNTMAAASAGLALFNNGSTIKDDIDRIEIVLGPQNALYGPNAHNALFNYITKDPRLHPGTSVSASVGSRQQFSTRLRLAGSINRKWAYKLTGEYATGRDYAWYDSVYAGSPNGTPFGPVVAIPEKITDFQFRRQRGEAHLYFRAAPRADIILSGGGSAFTRLQVTTSGRNQLRDVRYSFLQARLVHPRYFATVYNTWGDLGRSLLLGNYTRDYWNRTHSTQTTGPNRLLTPDSAELFARRLGNTVKERSQRLNADAQFNHRFDNAGLSVVAGLSYQLERPNGYGITLIDSFEKIRIHQYGLVLQLDQTLPFGLRLLLATRFDQHSGFGGFVSPRLALTKKAGSGSLRLTWGKAYSMPSIQAQFAGINRFLFGNAQGIDYIPNGVRTQDLAARRKTVALKPEEVRTWELGYRGSWKKVYLDLGGYWGLSRNFISPARSVGGRVVAVNGVPVSHNPAFAGVVGTGDTLRNASFSTFFNYGLVRTYGIDAGISYTVNRFVRLDVRYSWFGSDITRNDPKNDANQDNVLSAEERSLNAPRHRGVIVLGLQQLVKGKLGLNLALRSVERYDFYSGSQIGTAAGEGRRGRVGSQLKNFDWGPLGGFTSFDLDASFRCSEGLAVNAGVTNLFDTRQVEMVGSPSIGRLWMVEVKLQLPQAQRKGTK